MAIRLMRKNGYGRLSVCLLLAALLLSLWAVPASGEGAGPIINASGNRNIAPSVDPIGNSEGYSAVLYNNRNGLPTSEANTVAQTSEGFLWIGSYAGLIRYDGSSFERIDSTGGIANVRCLFVDSLDRLWIGTNDSGVFLMEKGRFQKWDRADGLLAVSIRAITEDDGGLIYIAGAAAGIATVDAGLQLRVLEDERIDGKTVLDLRRGGDGLVYGLTQDGDLFTVKDGALVTYLDHEDCRVEGILSIMPDPLHPGRLYLGTENSGICWGDLKSNFASLNEKDVAPLTSIKRMESIDGQIWICAENGIGRLDYDGFHLLKNVPLNNSVEHVMTDYEGNLWFVSSRQGVMKIVPNQFSDLFERYDLPAGVVNTTCIYGRKLFIGTDSGLIVMDGNERTARIPLKKAVTASGTDLEASDLLELLDGVRIRSILRDSGGRLWISAWRRYGLICYDQGKVTAYTQDDGLFANTVRAITECEDGSILAAGTGGVSVIRDGRVTACYGADDGIVNEEIMTVAEGFGHELILGSDGDGIYVISPDGMKRIGAEDGLRSEIILRIKRSGFREGYWVVTGNSLAFLSADGQVTTLQQFPYPNNYDLYENSKGDLWVLSSAGIYVASIQELLSNYPGEPVFYGMQSGLPYAPTVNAYSELTAEGDLYMAGSGGVVKVNIEKPFDNLNELKIVLPYIDADGERIYPDASGKFTLPGNANKLTIYPYVFNYSLIDPQVSFRLDGFDREDVTVTRSRLVPLDYTNLKIGAYSFVMTVKDPTGRSVHTVSFPIVKGRELIAGTAGTLIMNFASLFLMGGLLVYTSLYRKRGRLEDRLFLGLTLSNMAMAVGELLSCLLEYSTIPLAKGLMITGNTVLFISLTFFPYLLLVYFDLCADPDRPRTRRRWLLFGIPCFLFALLMLVNLKTGSIFSIEEGNVFRSGPLSERFFLPQWLVMFYSLLSLIKVYKVNLRLAALGIALIVIRLVWELWLPSVSSTSFIYTLVLVCVHLYVMDRPLYEEEAS